MPGLADHFSHMPPSGLQEMASFARTIQGATLLGIGDPNFTTPAHIIDAACAAAHDGHTHYAPAAGVPELRELIAAKVQSRNRLACDVANVAVTTGAAGGLFTALMALVDPGDEILIPNPGWPTYPAMAHAVYATPKFYPLKRELGFFPDLEALEASITPRTKVLISSSPANPTGVVLPRQTLEQMLDIARRHDLWFISDECYDEIILDGEHVSAGSIDPGVVTVFTFSKTYAMTGWRVGYVTAPADVTTAIVKAQRPVISTTSTISQKAAEAALAGSQDCVRDMVSAYRSRRDVLMEILSDVGVTFVTPTGAFYVMVDVPGNSLQFAQTLLRERLVSVTPGGAFGSESEGTVRVSLAASDEAIRSGGPQLADQIVQWQVKSSAAGSES